MVDERERIGKIPMRAMTMMKRNTDDDEEVHR